LERKLTQLPPRSCSPASGVLFAGVAGLPSFALSSAHDLIPSAGRALTVSPISLPRPTSPGGAFLLRVT